MGGYYPNAKGGPDSGDVEDGEMSGWVGGWVVGLGGWVVWVGGTYPNGKGGPDSGDVEDGEANQHGDAGGDVPWFGVGGWVGEILFSLSLSLSLRGGWVGR